MGGSGTQFEEVPLMCGMNSSLDTGSPSFPLCLSAASGWAWGALSAVSMPVWAVLVVETCSLGGDPRQMGMSHGP